MPEEKIRDGKGIDRVGYYLGRGLLPNLAHLRLEREARKAAAEDEIERDVCKCRTCSGGLQSILTKMEPKQSENEMDEDTGADEERDVALSSRSGWVRKDSG